MHFKNKVDPFENFSQKLIQFYRIYSEFTNALYTNRTMHYLGRVFLHENLLLVAREAQAKIIWSKIKFERNSTT
jgi:hypothetical protein